MGDNSTQPDGDSFTRLLRSRRLRHAMIGAAGGLLGGLGFSLAYNQSQGLLFEWVAAISGMAILVGALFGWLQLPKWVGRSLAGLLFVVPLFIGTLSPAVGQGLCAVDLILDGPASLGDQPRPAGAPIRLESTSRSTPLTIDLSEVTAIEFATPGMEPGSILTVRIGDTDPPLLAAVDSLVFHGPVGQGTSGVITVEETGLRTVAAAAGQTTISELPFGLVRLEGEVRGADGGLVCETVVWVRFVSSLFGNWVGVVTTVMHVTGVAAMAWALLAVPIIPIPIPSGPAVPKPIRMDTELRNKPGTRVRRDGRLEVGGEYELQIEVTLGLDEDDADNETKAVVTSSDLEHAAFTVSLSTPFFEIPITPIRPGPATVAVDIVDRGGLVRTEQLSLDVVAPAEPATGTHAHASQTLFQGSTFQEGDDERAVTIVMYRGEDESIDLRILDVYGNHLLSFDGPLQAATLDALTRGARDVLVAQLAGDRGFGAAFPARVESLDAWLPALAAEGQKLALELLPVPPEADPSPLAAHAPGDAIIQVNQDEAGLAHATVPWNLVYDRPVLITAATTVCPDFASHAPDDCPSAGTPTVVCPYGFWGYRYVVEQPPTWVHENAYQPPLRRVVDHETPAVSIGGEPSFAGWAQHRDEICEIDAIEPLVATDFESLHAQWAERSDDIDLIYFYTHHSTGDHPYIQLGDSRLDKVQLRGMRTMFADEPLVVLAGCGTGSQQLTSYASLIDEFRVRGASGVVGSEAVVTEAVAQATMTPFLKRVLGGEPVGRALLDVRRALLTEEHNPAGILYALYGRSDDRTVSRPGNGS